ncbi:MAG TPA: DUF6599 family protein [Polyangiaceae bacterium]|jgi:hypothetical protein|nr:DUF6599 family protein [Polyangiaceae bacterium]
MTPFDPATESDATRSGNILRGRTVARALAGALLGGLLLVGCKHHPPDDAEGAAPPPSASASKPGVCASGGGTPGDPVSAGFFPRVVGDYCVDPNGDTRAYGEDAKNTLDDVCIQQLDGECEVYKSFGLRRVVTLRYVDGLGSPGSVAITLSRFTTKEGAFGFFTKRVVADADPAHIILTELDAGASAALGSGIAYVWRGEYLAELSYTNELESPDQMRASGKRILPGIAKALGDKIPGDTSLPPAVASLPAEHRLRMGVTYVVGDILGISGLGGGAIGFYEDGAKRYRVFILLRSDEDAAKDVLETLKKVDRASTIKDVMFPALAFDTQRDDSSPRTSFVVGRNGKKVVGVGDDEFALGAGRLKDDEERAKLTKDEKLTLLKSLVSGG